MLEPEQIHQHDRSSDAEVLAMYFTRDFLVTETLGVLSCWQCVFKDNILHLEENQLQEVLSFARILLHEFRSDKPPERSRAAPHPERVHHRLRAHSAGLRPAAQRYTVPKPFNGLGIQFKILVDEHFNGEGAGGGICRNVARYPGHLNDTVKSTIDRSAKQIIDAKRIMEAKRLLFWQKHSVKQIAGKLNFDDDAYFSRFFKKHTGQTPALFQKTIREKYN